MIGFSVLLIIAICGLVVLNSEWMQKKYGYGQDVLATEKMIIAAYQRDSQGFDELVHLLCVPGRTDELLCKRPQGNRTMISRWNTCCSMTSGQQR